MQIKDVKFANNTTKRKDVGQGLLSCILHETQPILLKVIHFCIFIDIYVIFPLWHELHLMKLYSLISNIYIRQVTFLKIRHRNCDKHKTKATNYKKITFMQ